MCVCMCMFVYVYYYVAILMVFRNVSTGQEDPSLPLYNAIFCMKRNYCAVSSSLFVVAIVASVACLSCIKENLYLIQFFFPHSVPLSNAALFFAACYFYFSFFRSILFFRSFFVFMYMCDLIQSFPFSPFLCCCFFCSLVCLHAKTMLFVEKTYTIFGMKVCIRNHVESIFPLLRNIVAISILSYWCWPIYSITCSLMLVLALDHQCAFISGMFGRNMDDDIWKMVCSNIY